MKRVICTTFVTLSLLLHAPASASAQTSERADGMRFLPDVPGQFGALTERADPLGLRTGGSPDPSSCKHYQGVVRVQGADGTPFLLVTRSGNLPEFTGSGTGCNDSDGETDNGHLVVFRMGSREKHGERLRGNRLYKGVHVNDTQPLPEDKATIYFTVVGGDPTDSDPAKRPGLVFQDGEGGVPPPRVYQHPGGMQVVGDVLALAVEHPRQTGAASDCNQCQVNPSGEACQRCQSYEPASSPTMVMFFDVSNPEDPAFKSQFPLVDEVGAALGVAGTVAINPLPPAPGETEGRYLMMVTGGRHNPSLYFYRSSSTNLKDENLSWTFVDVWRAHTGRSDIFLPCGEGSAEDERGFCLSEDEQYLEQNWPDGNDGHTHQTLQFLRERDINGTLYLAGARGKFDSETSTIDLYRLDCETPLCDVGSQIKMKRVVTRDLWPFPNTGGKQLVSLAAASTFYVSPSGELLFYATEHDNDGPGDTVKVGEWRHKNVAREGSSTFLPSAVLDGPYEVDEGSSISLSGSAKPPITKAWIQLFHDTAFRSFYPVVDYEDYDLDDFDDFHTLEYLPRPFQQPFTQNDKARSWNWFAPAGCSIEVFDRQPGGGASRILAGAGVVEQVADLSGDFGDMYEKVDAVDFRADCDQYYAGPFLLRWDLDVDASYETTGSPVTFSAAASDGPSVVNVPAQAQHHSGGPAGQATARVSVRNVAPQLTPLRLTDGAGHEVNAQVPFVLTNLPVTTAASFGDPGVLDRQTATLAWGDGPAEPQTAFETFDEAFGDATGSASHTHRYPLAGSYTIALSVADDDGGVGTASTVVRVVTPERAVEEIIDLLDGVIADTASNSVRHDLAQARDALAGNNYYSNNGALEKIRDGNDQAAIASLQHAIERLRRAEAGGADVSTLIALLEQVAAALSAA